MAVKAAPIAPPVPVFNWIGFDIGGFGGYGWGHHDRLNDAGLANSYGSGGPIAGGLARYNWQIRKFVLGVEGDFAWADTKGDHNFVGGTRDEKRAPAFLPGLLLARPSRRSRHRRGSRCP
ncbi:hypothetical protein CO669_16975 [Bradyrhizobium sp. Y36]|uniref:outer membrane protein n=1 Tax=Bradyrhizobium sp. Y36 TaxID=2035447 RepID=UPI000BE81C2B|nr:hypothetical protein [Bradyrhizobium sp. Y36]PDT89251.1 hypothetical protein CO669_16975 [Bradyrhizobium sp. Y36]